MEEQNEEEHWDIDGEIDETVSSLREKALHGVPWTVEDNFLLISAVESFILKTRADHLNFQKEMLQDMNAIFDSQTENTRLLTRILELMPKTEGKVNEQIQTDELS